MTETLLISDLHLSREQPRTIELFLQFLSQRAPRAKRLYILGDLFDSWVGDDDTSPPIPSIIDALGKLTQAGTQVFIQHGNRDFLLGTEFMATTGCSQLEDIHLAHLGGVPTLLMHGDLLCTDDLDYQKARSFLRSTAFAQDFLSRDIQERMAIAADYRNRSGEATSLKAEEIMDVNQQEVQKVMSEQGALRLIHGHTHRPGRHEFLLQGQAAERYVLSEWHPDRGEILWIRDDRVGTEEIVSGI